MNFHISHVSITAFNRVYEDLILVVKETLIDLGHSCTVGVNEFKEGSVNLLIGATVFAARFHALLDRIGHEPFIVYQLEPLSESAGLLPEWAEYLQLLQKANWIVDYSPTNLPFYNQFGLADKVSIIEPGFHRCIERFRPAPAKDIDVLFYGSAHPRREAIVNGLQSAGLNVSYHNYVVGDELDGLIKRSKVVLNVHAWAELSHLETVRLSYLLSNRSLVVSERAAHNPYGEGVVYFDYQELVEGCVGIINSSESLRNRIANLGYLAIRQYDFAEHVAEMVQRWQERFGEQLRASVSTAIAAISSASSYRERPEVVGLVPLEAQRILDVGCENGLLGGALKARQDCHVTGVESDVQAAADAAKQLDLVVCGKVLEILPQLEDRAFDAIILADQLGFEADTQALLAVLNQKLKNDGVLILSVPNIRHWSLIKHLLEGGWDYQDAGLLDRRNKRFFTARTLVNDLAKARFVVESDSAVVTQNWQPSPQLVAALAEAGIAPADGLLGCTVFKYLLVCKKM